MSLRPSVFSEVEVGVEPPSSSRLGIGSGVEVIGASHFGFIRVIPSGAA